MTIEGRVLQALSDHPDWVHLGGANLVHCLMCDWEEPSNLDHAQEKFAKHQATMVAAIVREAAQPVIIHHGDPDTYAAACNEGFETAVAQGLADDPTLAYDWLQQKLREAQAEALREAADELDKLWYERLDRPENGGRDWADGVEQAETLVRARADRIEKGENVG